MRTMLIAAVVALATTAGAQQRGHISDQARENYRQAVEGCYQPPNDLRKIIDCLKRQFRTEDDTLNTICKRSRNFMRSSPKDIAQLRDAQRAWLQFRDKNCAFAKLAAVKGPYEEEFLYDCLVALTIDRWTELSSLIGD